MPKINVVNADNIVEYNPQKAYFKLKNTGGPKGDKGDQGEPGVSATITVASTTTGASGTNASVVNQGTEQDAQLAFTIPRGEKGEKGDTGDRGFSPIAWVTRGDDYVRINIQNERSTSVATVYDGADGYSPSASVTQTATGATLSVTDEQGTTTADILNGTDGTDGTDGYSPIATVTQTSTGATITITDKTGTTTADITNGQDAPTYTAGANVQINNGVISATDTTYSAFTGSTSSADGSAGLVPQPLIADTDKYLKGDGTWATVSAGPTVVQTTGQSTTDVMSQKAVTDIIGNVETLLHTLNSGSGV